MDRVYHTDDHVYNLFIDYSKIKNWYRKDRNNSDVSFNLVSPSDKIDSVTVVIPIKKFSYKRFPYADTLCYFDTKKLTLSNKSSSSSSSNCHCLRSTSGGHSSLSGDGVNCDGEGKWWNTDDSVYINFKD